MPVDQRDLNSAAAMGGLFVALLLMAFGWYFDNLARALVVGPALGLIIYGACHASAWLYRRIRM